MADSSSSGEGQKDASACRSDTTRFRLTKEDRILRSAEYKRIAKEGVRYRTLHFYIRMLENPQGRSIGLLYAVTLQPSPAPRELPNPMTHSPERGVL